MGHVTEDVPRIAHNLVGSMSFDMADEPDSTHPTVWKSSEGSLGREIEARSMRKYPVSVVQTRWAAANQYTAKDKDKRMQASRRPGLGPFR